ncbi:transposable element Tcb1 transposase [Elysia marginata]|uniref:Transposable element Tcb1 transposase n=1 Tax=Elysia marginata TaxID=1093978 RepID=A0AAV4FKB4_9GAST|nr:transposable element Tcb1 transposase [Elysia marginata]
MHRNIVFQQDIARAHTARYTQQFFKQCNFQVLPWPAHSRDLNPIEHLWDYLQRIILNIPYEGTGMLFQDIFTDSSSVETNEEILTEAQTTRQLITKIRKRQAKFVGHVIRRNQLEHLVTTGKFDGKRGRGTPREKMLDSLADWMNIEKPSEMIRKMSCRDGWRSLIAHASRHGT